MLEDILSLERNLFLWLNGCHTPFFDQFFWLYSGLKTWLPVALVFLTAMFYKNFKHWRTLLLFVVAIALIFTICDQFSSHICKPFFARYRPSHHPDFKDYVSLVFNYHGGLYGFISGHSANSFGFATLTALALRYRPFSISIFLWATINAYSRIYLGVHFISDIVPGILSGIFFGWIVYKLYAFGENKLLTSGKETMTIRDLYSRSRLKLFLVTLLIFIVIMMIFSLLYSTEIIPAITIR
ncbi:MAG: phosphatase PAP2 family protein [Tannerella sp.]|jgi:undecaprenyl-diphosphatase|nr:phosphatase PAP2 family protein [Tannerella sp.]